MEYQRRFNITIDSFTFSQLRKRERVIVAEGSAAFVVGKEVRRALTTKCIRRLERFERLELLEPFERPTSTGDWGFGLSDGSVGSERCEGVRVASKNTPSALYCFQVTVGSSNHHALTKMAITVPDCSRISLARTVCGSRILLIIAIYQRLTSDVLDEAVMERDLPGHSFGRTKFKGRKLAIKLEKKHV